MKISGGTFMKYEFYHFGTDKECGHELARLPLFDLNYYRKKNFEYLFGRYTGKFYDSVLLEVTILRRCFRLFLHFNHCETTPEKARQMKLNRLN